MVTKRTRMRNLHNTNDVKFMFIDIFKMALRSNALIILALLTEKNIAHFQVLRFAFAHWFRVLTPSHHLTDEHDM